MKYFLSLLLSLGFSSSLFAQGPDDFDIPEDDDEMYEMDEDEGGEPEPQQRRSTRPDIRRPPVPKGITRRNKRREIPNRNQRERIGRRQSGGGSTGGSSGKIVFKLADPPEYWEPKKRPKLKAPKGFKPSSSN